MDVAVGASSLAAVFPVLLRVFDCISQAVFANAEKRKIKEFHIMGHADILSPSSECFHPSCLSSRLVASRCTHYHPKPHYSNRVKWASDMILMITNKTTVLS